VVTRARLFYVFTYIAVNVALYHLSSLRVRHYRHCSEVAYRHSTTNELAGHTIPYRTVIYCFSFSKQCSVLEVHSCTDCWQILFPLWYPCGVRGGAFGWDTALQVGRSRVRFPMVSLEFFIDIILRPHYGPGVDSASNRNEYQEYFLGDKGGRSIGLTTLPPSCADCHEIWEP